MTDFILPGDIYTTAEAARIKGCSPATIVRACNSGELKHFTTPGGHRRIHVEDFRKWMAARS